MRPESIVKDIRSIFEQRGTDRLGTRELVTALKQAGHDLDTMGLADVLRPLQIAPAVMRIGTSTPRGYYAADFNRAMPAAPDLPAIARVWLPEGAKKGSALSVVEDQGKVVLIMRSPSGEISVLPMDAPEPVEDRVTCSGCSELMSNGVCLGAIEGKVLGAPQVYHPDRGQLRRCTAFIPMANDPDQRPGSERWESLGLIRHN